MVNNRCARGHRTFDNVKLLSFSPGFQRGYCVTALENRFKGNHLLGAPRLAKT